MSLLIEDRSLCPVIFEAFSDKTYRDILLTLIGEPKAIHQVAEEKQIPLGSCYRKVHWLCDHGLVKLARITIFANGKKVAYYHSIFSDVIISFGPEGMNVKLDFEKFSSYCTDPGDPDRRTY